MNAMYIRRIRSLLSITADDFEILYQPIIVQANDCFLEMGSHQAAQKDTIALENTLKVLEYRQGYLLPFGIGLAPDFPAQEAWTYALCISVLFKDYRAESTFELLKSTMPVVGHQWLEAHPILYQHWWQYFCDQGTGFFSSLIDQALSTTIYSESSALQTIPTVDDFLQWIGQGISKHHFPCNQKDAVVYGVDQGVFLPMPQALLSFLEARSQLSEQSHLERALRKQKALVRDAKGARIHHFYWGAWQERQRLSGVIIDWRYWEGKRLLPVDDNLHVDPIG